MFAFLDIVKRIDMNFRLCNHKKRKRQTPLDIVFSLLGLPPMHCASVIFLPAHPASFAHNFVSGMQSFYFSESQDAMVLQTCHENSVLDS